METNAQHYNDFLIRIASECDTYLGVMSKWLDFAESHGMNSNSGRIKGFVEWLADEYDVTNNLTGFETDLLLCLPNRKFSFFNYPELIEMQKLGYFKDIPSDAVIEELLNKLFDI